jgi:anthranilate phosphoribosyltransferase
MSTHYRNKLAQLKDGEHPFAQYVRILGKGKTGSRSLSRDEAYQAMQMILAGSVEDLQLGAFLMLLRVKEESSDELTGFVAAVKDHILKPEQPIAADLDWASYAGKKKQLPWFLLSCFLLADQGIRVYMHGCAGHTLGRLYTEDVLNKLGVKPAKHWEQVRLQLDQSNFSFMSLEFLCPELKNIIDFRNYLGLRSPVHTLSRLLNPLDAHFSMQSIFHPSYAHSHQQAALTLGQPNAAVFKGEGGEIERKPEATCLVKTIADNVASEESWPKILDGRQPQPDTLDIHQLKLIWRGSVEDDYAYHAIISTAAVALKLLNKAETQQAALELAKHYWSARNTARLG